MTAPAHRRRLARLGVGVALTVAACGRSVAYDVATLEAGIPAAVVPERPDLVTDVDCPDALPRDVVSTTCTATLAGTPVDVAVAIASDESVAVTVRETLLDMTAVESAAGARLTDDLGVDTRVSCVGPPVRVSVPDTVVDCVATDAAGATHGLVVTVIDDEGGWTLALAVGG